MNKRSLEKQVHYNINNNIKAPIVEQPSPRIAVIVSLNLY